MKTIDFGQYDGNGSQVQEESGALGVEDFEITWVTPDVCKSGNLAVTIPSQNGEIEVTFHGKTLKALNSSLTFQFGDNALVPNSHQKATGKSLMKTAGITAKLTVKSRD